jgi:Ca2+-binding EF-hand superfamily protein
MDLKAMDKNKDGSVDKDEFIKAMEELRKRFQGGGGGGAPGA